MCPVTSIMLAFAHPPHWVQHTDVAVSVICSANRALNSTSRVRVDRMNLAAASVVPTVGHCSSESSDVIGGAAIERHDDRLRCLRPINKNTAKSGYIYYNNVV